MMNSGMSEKQMTPPHFGRELYQVGDYEHYNGGRNSLRTDNFIYNTKKKRWIMIDP